MWPVLRTFGVAFLLVVLDQLSKAAALAYLPSNRSVPVIGNEFFRLTLVQNPGVIFGCRFFPPSLLLIIALIASVVLSVFLVKLIHKRSPLRFSVTLLLAGAVGNVIDRIRFGHVVDFLDFDFPDFIMQRWPVFNVADSCITVGMTLLVVMTLFFSKHPSEQKTIS